MGFATAVYPGSSFFTASWAINGVMEEIYRKGITTAFQDKTILFEGVDIIVGLGKVREVEAYYYKDILSR